MLQKYAPVYESFAKEPSKHKFASINRFSYLCEITHVFCDKMKKLLTLLLPVLSAIVLKAETSHDYTVQTSKAPVWAMQTVQGPVTGYLDYGVTPASEIDENDPQWVYVEYRDIKGWAHILSLRHSATEPIDIELANGSLVDMLKSNDVDTDIIKKIQESKPPRTATEYEPEADNYYDAEVLPSSVEGKRGLPAMYIYVIPQDVECDVNASWRTETDVISIVENEHTFEAGTWFATDTPASGDAVLFHNGKGFDVPADAYHMLTEQEYNAYLDGNLKLQYNPELGTLKNFLSDHDIAQSTNWSETFAQFTKTNVWDMWPALIPILLMAVVILLSIAVKGLNPTIWATAAIAMIVVELAIIWHYINTPEAQFNDWGGLAWIVIGLFAIVNMAATLICAAMVNNQVLKYYNVNVPLKQIAVAVLVALAVCIVIDIVLINIFDWEKDSLQIGIVNITAILLSIIAWLCKVMLKQNRRILPALPVVFLLWGIAIAVGSALLAIALFAAFALWFYKFCSGAGMKLPIIPGLVGSENATCGKCALYGSVHCPRTHPGSSDSACDKFHE